MSVIIRLQNLPWSANALDIRQYFQGLSIPEGGVHIVGGELGDAFIAFSTDEDARQAFNLNNGKIKEVQIKLMLSSRTEMQKVIEAARNQSLAAFMQTAPSTALPAAVPPVVPAAVPEVKKASSKEKDGKKDKRRSRSRSKERKDRGRDKRDNRRHRDRSRSRSRDKRDRRRRDRSRSRNRTRSKDRDRKGKDDKGLGNFKKDAKPVVWETPLKPDLQQQQQMLIQKPLLSNFLPNLNLEEARRNLNALNVPVLQAAVQERLLFNQNQAADAFGPSPRDPWQHPGGRQDFQDGLGLGGARPPLLGAFGGQPPFADGRMFNRMMPKGPINRFGPPMMDRGNGEPLRNCCVEVTPFYGAYGDVRRFFQDLFISNTGIKYVSDEFGKRTGSIYVRFAYPEGKEQALQRNGHILRNTPVEVRHIDDEVFDSYIPPKRQMDFDGGDHFRQKNNNQKPFSKPNEQPPTVFTCLVVEDLPSFAKEQDILKMFSDYPLTSIIVVSKSRQNRAAYVKFNNAEDAKKALSEQLKHVIDGKAVSVKPCKDEEFAGAEQEQNGVEDTEKEESLDIILNTECVVLNDLPLKINDRDISDFFSDIGLIPLKIHLMSNHLGFTGTAFCEFNSKEEAVTAVEKDGTPFGSNVVSVKLISRGEMENLLGIPMQRGNLMNQGRPRPFMGPRGNFGGMHNRMNFMGPRMRRFQPQNFGVSQEIGPPGCTVLMENVPYKAGLDEILEFFDGFDIRTDSVLRRFNDNGTPSGEAKVLFNTPDEAAEAVQIKSGSKIRERQIYLTQI